MISQKSLQIRPLGSKKQPRNPSYTCRNACSAYMGPAKQARRAGCASINSDIAPLDPYGKAIRKGSRLSTGIGGRHMLQNVPHSTVSGGMEQP